MDKDTKEKIKQLKKEKNYEEIYYEFGSKIYNRYVPNRYKRRDIRKLTNNGKYEDIYNKYGKKQYNKMLVDAKYNDIKENGGIFKATLWNIGRKFKLTGLMTGLLLSASTATTAIEVEQIKNDNAVEYQKDIEEYNKKISKYSKEIKAMNLNDIQTFMKVMDDMWKNIKGYGTPQNNVFGFYELDLATEEGVGVCRNMASDIAQKLNKINSEYNARTMTVYMGEDGIYRIADIERNIVEDNETVKDSEETENTEEQVENTEELLETSEETQDSKEQVETNEQVENNENSIFKNIDKLTGNHMVTFVDVPKDDLIVVLDPTNPGIGIYKNGNITMLNSEKGNGIEYDAKEYSGAVFINGGLNGIVDAAEDYVKSFKPLKLTYEEIENKYGLEAQNKALYEVRTMDTKDKRKKFVKSLNIDVLKTNKEKNNTNIEGQTKTIENEDNERE